MSTVHILVRGRALCGLAGIPRDWPAGHSWTGLDQLGRASCQACMAERLKRPLANNGTPDELPLLVERIQALSPPDRLRFAAELLEKGRGRMAYPIIDAIAKELGALIALEKLQNRSSGGQPPEGKKGS